MFECKIVNIIVPVNFNICFGRPKFRGFIKRREAGFYPSAKKVNETPGQKNRFIETVLLSPHNICFG